MKKLLFIAVMLVSALGMSAQKFALVDMEYILKNIPAYERANEQLSQVAKKWQAEVDAMGTEVQTLYKNYQNESVFLSQEQKKARQEAILAKEKEASELKKKYFGPEGELFKKRTMSSGDRKSLSSKSHSPPISSATQYHERLPSNNCSLTSVASRLHALWNIDTADIPCSLFFLSISISISIKF